MTDKVYTEVEMKRFTYCSLVDFIVETKRRRVSWKVMRLVGDNNIDKRY